MTIAERLGLGNCSREGKKKAAPTTDGLLRTRWRAPRDVLIVAIILLSSSASFGLGMLAGRSSGEGERGSDFWIENLSQPTLPVAAGATPAKVDEPAVVPVQKETEMPAAPAAGGAYVASKTGTKYYLPWCGTAKRIKEENKVWFASKTEAEAAGYEPAKNCKGI